MRALVRGGHSSGASDRVGSSHQSSLTMSDPALAEAMSNITNTTCSNAGGASASLFFITTASCNNKTASSCAPHARAHELLADRLMVLPQLLLWRDTREVDQLARVVIQVKDLHKHVGRREVPVAHARELGV